MLAVEKVRPLLAKRMAASRAKGILPGDLLDLVEQLYDVQLAARSQAQVTLPQILPEAAQRSQGVSLVERSVFPFDQAQSKKLFYELLLVVAGITSALAEGCAILEAAIKAQELDLDQAFQAHLRGDEAFFAPWAVKIPATPRILPMLIQAAMIPSIERAAELLSVNLDAEATWQHGHCPVCGSLPLISDLREKEGFCFHTCSFCHADYRASRLQCPYCLETDTAKLYFYEAKEEPGFRINACRGCSMYIKVTDFRNMDRKALPLVDDLDSLGLDIVAREKKLQRPTLSAWGF